MLLKFWGSRLWKVGVLRWSTKLCGIAGSRDFRLRGFAGSVGSRVSRVQV